MLLPIEIEKISKDAVFIDVRSPGEYEESTIPGAINMPIFSNEERAEIGTLYKQVGTEVASREGIKIASNKLLYYYDEVVKLKKHHKDVVFFCARGGMRSGSISTFLDSLGLGVMRVKGGYKSYRRYVMESLPKINDEVEYIVIHGNTGVGKTILLEKLKEQGYDILDLEGAANHRGSLLGNVGLGKQKGLKMFESLIHKQLDERKSKYIIVEAESKRIGRVFVPQYIFDKMQEGKHIFVDANIGTRVKVIMDEYTKKDNYKEDILESLDKLTRYISKAKIEEYKKAIINDELEWVVEELMVKYYDPMYENLSDKIDYSLKVDISDIDKGMYEIIDWIEELKEKDKEEQIER